MEGAFAGQLPFLLMMFGIIFFFMILPQQRRAKKEKTFKNSMKKGDRVIYQVWCPRQNRRSQ